MSKFDFSDLLLPDFSAFEQSLTFPTKDSLIDAFKSSDKEKVLKSKKERLRKSTIVESVDHKIFTLAAIPENKVSAAFRFVVNANGQILFGIEDTAGVDIPGHFRIALITPETKEIPKGYDNPQGHVALSAGRVFLRNNKIFAIDHNSSAFEPDPSILLRALAIMFAANPEILASEIEIKILDKRGKPENSHKFSKDEIIALINEKFSKEEQQIMKEKNSANNIIHLRRDRGKKIDTQIDPESPSPDSSESSPESSHFTPPGTCAELSGFFGTPKKEESKPTTLESLSLEDSVSRKVDEQKHKENRRPVSRKLLGSPVSKSSQAFLATPRKRKTPEGRPATVRRPLTDLHTP